MSGRNVITVLSANNEQATRLGRAACSRLTGTGNKMTPSSSHSSLSMLADVQRRLDRNYHGELADIGGTS